jgi:hypothetical protein
MRIKIIVALMIIGQGFVASPSITNHVELRKAPDARIFLRERHQIPFEIAQVPTSNRCFTPYFWCYLPGYAPIDTPCWCASPNGPVGGVVR